MREHIDNPASYLFHFLFLHAACGQRRGSQPDSGSHKGRTGFKRHRILINRDSGYVKRMFSIFAGNILAGQIHQHQMIVSAAGHQLIPRIHDAGGKLFRVSQHLLLIRLELGPQSLSEGNCLRRNDVHERSTLNTWKNLTVEALFHISDIGASGQNHAAARSAQSLMRGGGRDMCMRQRRRMEFSRHQTGNMRHIHHQPGSDLIRNFAEPGEINHPGVCACPGHNQGGLVLPCQAFHRIVIDQTSLFFHAIGNDMKKTS